MDGEGNAREARLRLALLRKDEHGARLLRELLAIHGGVSEALLRLDDWPAPVRDRLAWLCDPAALATSLAPEDHAFLAHEDAAMLVESAPDWPPLLSEAVGAPPLLSCLGDRSVLSRPQVAIVGSRHASPAGLSTARAFAADLARAGFTITSGLALGIDAMAHEGALAAGGMTIAVLGCGADRVYPQRHAALAARVRRQGCLVSEQLPGAPPLAPNFPQRNRIISALSLGVLVIEAAPDSGSLITARYAAEQGREVFAVPGSIHSPLSRGCHQLIREGATLVETSAQLMEAIAHFARTPARLPLAFAALDPPAVSPAGNCAPEALALLAHVSAAGSAVDELVLSTGRAVAHVSALLGELALAGMVHPLPGGRWQRTGSG